MNDEQAKMIADAIDDLGYSKRDRTAGPGALEGIAMALAGESLRTPVGTSLEAIAVEIRTHGEAVESVARQLGRIAAALEAIAAKIPE